MSARPYTITVVEPVPPRHVTPPCPKCGGARLIGIGPHAPTLSPQGLRDCKGDIIGEVWP